MGRSCWACRATHTAQPKHVSLVTGGWRRECPCGVHQLHVAYQRSDCKQLRRSTMGLVLTVLPMTAPCSPA